MKVIAIEGNKDEVDKVYNHLKEIIDMNRIDQLYSNKAKYVYAFLLLLIS